MGRRRSRDLHLPPRLHRKGGAYYHVKGSKWIPLGSELAQARVRWAQLENADSGADIVSVLIDRCLQAKWFTDLRPSTCRNYTRMAETLRKCFGHMAITAVQAGDVADYLDQHRHPLVANNEVALLSVMYEKALRWRLSDRNPCKGISRNPIPRRKRYITDQEFSAIWQAARPTLRLAMDLAYLTGLRIGDLCRLRFADVREGVLYVVQQKTGEPIDFEVGGELAEVLVRAREELRPQLRPTVLCGRLGRQYDPKNLSRDFSATAARVGVQDVHFHDLRAKTASDDPEGAKERLGHKDARTTGWYIRRRKAVRPMPGFKKIRECSS